MLHFQFFDCVNVTIEASFNELFELFFILARFWGVMKNGEFLLTTMLVSASVQTQVTRDNDHGIIS
jgi:hypothetical protein